MKPLGIKIRIKLLQNYRYFHLELCCLFFVIWNLRLLILESGRNRQVWPLTAINWTKSLHLKNPPLPAKKSLTIPSKHYVGMVFVGGSSSSSCSCRPFSPLGRLVSSVSPPVPSTNSSYVDFSLNGLGPKSSIMSSRPSTSFSRSRKAIWKNKVSYWTVDSY